MFCRGSHERWVLIKKTSHQLARHAFRPQLEERNQLDFCRALHCVLSDGGFCDMANIEEIRRCGNSANGCAATTTTEKILCPRSREQPPKLNRKGRVEQTAQSRGDGLEIPSHSATASPSSQHKQCVYFTTVSRSCHKETDEKALTVLQAIHHGMHHHNFVHVGACRVECTSVGAPQLVGTRQKQISGGYHVLHSSRKPPANTLEAMNQVVTNDSIGRQQFASCARLQQAG